MTVLENITDLTKTGCPVEIQFLKHIINDSSEDKAAFWGNDIIIGGDVSNVGFLVKVGVNQS